MNIQNIEKKEKNMATFEVKVPADVFDNAVNEVYKNWYERTCLNTITAVSYTHLDVYKRQGLRGGLPAPARVSHPRAQL